MNRSGRERGFFPKEMEKKQLGKQEKEKNRKKL